MKQGTLTNLFAHGFAADGSILVLLAFVSFKTLCMYRYIYIYYSIGFTGSLGSLVTRDPGSMLKLSIQTRSWSWAFQSAKEVADGAYVAHMWRDPKNPCFGRG